MIITAALITPYQTKSVKFLLGAFLSYEKTSSDTKAVAQLVCPNDMAIISKHAMKHSDPKSSHCPSIS